MMGSVSLSVAVVIVELGLTVRPIKHITGHIGDNFYGSDDPTNSVKH